MQSFGFIELIKPEYQTYIITSYYYPPAPFHFETFYNKLSEKSMRNIFIINFTKKKIFILDQLIYPGKTTVTDCFRIGNIGRLFENDMKILADSIQQVCKEMNIDLPLKNVIQQ